MSETRGSYDAGVAAKIALAERYDQAVGRAVSARRWHEAAKGEAKRAKAELDDALRELLALREAASDARYTQLTLDAQMKDGDT
jgi:hypothetical protein